MERTNRSMRGPDSAVGVVGATGLAIATFVARPLLAHQPTTHLFLIWNLALAWVPYAAALTIDAAARARRRPDSRLDSTVRWTVLLSLGAVWLLFLPNAPYLVSDLAHFDSRSRTPWLDLTQYVAFAWAGCSLAVASIRIVHRRCTRRWGRMAGWSVVLLAAATAGPGVAIGRFGRLNSWEVATNPFAVLGEAVRLGTDRRAVSLSIFFALLLLVAYVGSSNGDRATGSPSRPT